MSCSCSITNDLNAQDDSIAAKTVAPCSPVPLYYAPIGVGAKRRLMASPPTDAANVIVAS